MGVVQGGCGGIENGVDIDPDVLYYDLTLAWTAKPRSDQKKHTS